MPFKVSLIFSLSFTLKGLKITMNIPLIMLLSVCCEAKPTATANIPAPASMEFAIVLILGTE